FAAWTSVTRLTIDGARGWAAVPSAVASTTNASASAYRTLDASYPDLCLSAQVNVSRLASTTLSLLRVLTSTGGAVARVFVNPSGILYARSDVSGIQMSSKVVIGSGWHAIEICVTTASAGTIELYRDGLPIVSGFQTSTGSTPIGRVLIGDTGSKTFTVN